MNQTNHHYAATMFDMRRVDPFRWGQRVQFELRLFAEASELGWPPGRPPVDRFELIDNIGEAAPTVWRLAETSPEGTSWLYRPDTLTVQRRPDLYGATATIAND